MSDFERLKRVWNQTGVPVILRGGKGKGLLVRLPYAVDNRARLRRDRRTIPEWDPQKKHWQVPASWLNKLVSEFLTLFGRVYIIQPYREQEKCAPACWNAAGHECQCSCMGERHGSGHPSGSWWIASDTFATQWGEQKLACRLLSRR